MKLLDFSINLILPAALVVLGSTEHLTKMNTLILSGGKWCHVAREIHKVSAIGQLVVYKKQEASTSHNRMGLHGMLCC
jgi:hypothetical protein